MTGAIDVQTAVYHIDQLIKKYTEAERQERKEAASEYDNEESAGARICLGRAGIYSNSIKDLQNLILTIRKA